MAHLEDEGEGEGLREAVAHLQHHVLIARLGPRVVVSKRDARGEVGEGEPEGGERVCWRVERAVDKAHRGGLEGKGVLHPHVQA